MSVLASIQEDLANKLLADPFFADVPVLTERIQDIEYEIDKAIAGIGVVVILITPTAGVEFKNLPGPYFDHIRIVARVVENVTVNQSDSGTKKGALTIAEHVAALLHRYTPEGLSEPVLCDKDTIRLVSDPLNLSYDIVFETKGGVSYETPKLEVPEVHQGTTTITITHPNSRALIVYSVDGVTHPSPRNAIAGTALFYDEPFEFVGIGKKILVRVWMPGYLSSQLVSYTTV